MVGEVLATPLIYNSVGTEMPKLKHGLYAAEFSVRGKSASGIVVLGANGSVLGGDSDMFYIGQYEDLDGKLEGTFDLGKHSQGPEQGFLGREARTVHFEGRVSRDGKSAEVQGRSPQVPGVALRVILTRITD